MKGVIGWLLQRITGVVLFAGLLIHMVVMHFSGPEKIDHATVMERLSNPCWIVFDIIFLILVLYHGFNGMWGIAIEYIGSKKQLLIFQSAIFIATLTLAATGIYIISF